MVGTRASDGPGRTLAQWVCLVAGVLLVGRGLLGLATGQSFDAPAEGWHSVVHLVTGAALLTASPRADRAGPAALAFGIFYAGLVATGAVDGHDVAGVIPVQGSDHVVHSLYAAAGLTGGAAWWASTGGVRSPGRRGRP